MEETTSMSPEPKHWLETKARLASPKNKSTPSSNASSPRNAKSPNPRGRHSKNSAENSKRKVTPVSIDKKTSAPDWMGNVHA